MNKSIGFWLGMVLSKLILYSLLPTAFACDYSVDVYAGQPITLTATPNTPAGAYEYLWTADFSLQSNTSNYTISDHAPSQGGPYSINILVSSNGAPDGTCVDYKTICLNVIGTTYCPLCEGDFCTANEPAATNGNCPPLFNYAGLTNPYYIYHYTTLGHTGYTGVTLQEGPTANYILDWSLLDQPTDTDTEICTTLKFWITQNSTAIGTTCEREICLYYDPTAAIIAAY